MQPLWKTLQRFLKKLKRITIEPSNSTLRYILEKWQALIWKDTHTPIFICSVAQSCLCDAMDSSTARTKSGLCVNLMVPANRLILCPALLPPSVFPIVRVFSNELALHNRWPSTGASASASVLPMKIQGWFPLGLTGLISLQSKGLSIVFSNTTVGKHQFFSPQFYDPTLTLYMTTGKSIALMIQTFVDKIMSMSLPMFMAASFKISNIWKKMWYTHVCVHARAHAHTHTHTHRNTTQPLKKKFCHLQWRGWTWRVSC